MLSIRFLLKLNIVFSGCQVMTSTSYLGKVMKKEYLCINLFTKVMLVTLEINSCDIDSRIFFSIRTDACSCHDKLMFQLFLMQFSY